MKRFFFVALVLLLIAFNAQATVYYFNLASGNDTTGDGSYGNPWKTIDKCTTGRTGGDECRGAATTVTTLGGTLTFTNGSTTVNTSTDLTAVVAAGDLVGKNSGLESWWRVASLNSTTITLNYQYWGLSGSGDAVTGYKITPVTASEQYDVGAAGSSATSRLKISGGWDLASQAQVGVTCFASSYTRGISIHSGGYIELEKFIISETGASGIYVQGPGCYYHDLWVTGATTALINVPGNSYRSSYLDISISGGTGNGFSGNDQSSTYENVYLFSVGTGSSDNGINIVSPASIFKNLRVYNFYTYGITLTGENASGNLFVDCIVDTGRQYAAVYLSSGTHDNRFYNLTASVASNAVLSGSGNNNYFVESTLSSSGASKVNRSSGTYYDTFSPYVIYKEVGADSIMYFGAGTITHDSSADARSGKCLKISCTTSFGPILYKVGSVKIPNADSALTLSAYIKDDASYDGLPYFLVLRNGKFISKTSVTPTTSYVKTDFVVGTSDLVAGEYLDLIVAVDGTAGNLFVDDFSADQ